MEETKTEETEVTEEVCEKKSFCKLDLKKKIILAALVILIIAGGAAFYFKKQMQKADVGPQAVKERIENLVKDSGANVTVGDISKEGDLYKVVINAGGKDQPVYVTRDGKNLIQNMVSFDEIDKQRELANKEKPAPAEIPKTDKPKVDLYVMSFCPYGNKSEDTLKSVYDLLKNKVDFNFHYIVGVSGDTVSSLHGQKEVVQDEREACVLKNYGKDAWFSFVSYVNKNCGSDGACWEAGARTLRIDVNKVNYCVNSQGIALMKDNEKKSNDAKANGSPTMQINGVPTDVVYQYGKSEDYKQAICGAFNKVPAECSKILSSQEDTTNGGSCGN